MKDRSTSSSTSQKDKQMHSNGFLGVALFIIVLLVFLILYVKNFENQLTTETNPSETTTTSSTTTTLSSPGSIGLPYSEGPSAPPENLSQPTSLPPSND